MTRIRIALTNASMALDQMASNGPAEAGPGGFSKPLPVGVIALAKLRVADGLVIARQKQI